MTSSRMSVRVLSACHRVRRPDLGDVGDAPGHVLETDFVRNFVGQVDDRRGTPVRSMMRVANCSMRDFLRATHIEHVADRPGSSSRATMPSTTSATWQKQRVCVPSPKTVNGSPARAWRTKRGDDHAVRRALARPDRIEQPNHYRRQVSLAVVGIREDLIDRFGGGVGPASTAGEPRMRSACSLRVCALFFPYISEELATNTFRR